MAFPDMVHNLAKRCDLRTREQIFRAVITVAASSQAKFKEITFQLDRIEKRKRMSCMEITAFLLFDWSLAKKR